MDRRDYINTFGSLYPRDTKFHENDMTLEIPVFYTEEGAEIEESVRFPAKYEVCETCNGKGKHVNPSIDSHGITASEFAEDPDFREEYMSGAYDVPCYECEGKRVVPRVDEEACKGTDLEKRLKDLENNIQSEHECRMTEMAERRMGA